MTDSQPPRNGAGPWRTPDLSECFPLDEYVFPQGVHARVSVTYGYLDSDLVFYRYDYEELTGKKWVCLRRIWTAEEAVRDASYGPRGALLSENDIHALTCQEDILSAHPDVTKVIMQEFKVRGKNE